MNLAAPMEIGWSDFFQQRFEAFAAATDIEATDELSPYRVVIEYQDRFRLLGADGHVMGFLTGSLLRDANEDRFERPAVGDWVVARLGEDGNATIVHLLERRTRFIRQAAGRKVMPQVIAANIDAVFIVTSCNQDFNPRRLERYLTTVDSSGARPLVVVNKSDLADSGWGPDGQAYIDQIAELAPGVPAFLVSATEERGLERIRQEIEPGMTVALVGSSGVGKSTLINQLLGEDVQEVRAIRERDGRGRHTTTHRELIVMAEGGILIDTPGMRELKLWSPGEALKEAFPDITELAESCRFRDCAHGSEPGCAVSAAVDAGRLDPSRFHNYLELGREEQVRSARVSDPKKPRPPSSRRKSGWHRR